MKPGSRSRGPLLRLAIRREPEFAFDDLCHHHAGMKMAAGLEIRSDLDRGVDHFQIGAGNVGLLQNRALDRRRLQRRLLGLWRGRSEKNE